MIVGTGTCSKNPFDNNELVNFSNAISNGLLEHAPFVLLFQNYTRSQIYLNHNYTHDFQRTAVNSSPITLVSEFSGNLFLSKTPSEDSGGSPVPPLTPHDGSATTAAHG